MTAFIENYRGFDIVFDTDKSTFIADGDDYRADKQSYVTCKKAIDDYIKENQEFKPFMGCKISYSGEMEKVKFIGLRKDGRWMIENSNSKIEQLASYNEKDYFVYDAANEPRLVVAFELNRKIDVLRADLQSVLKNLIKKPISEIKSKYQQ